jgi:hypothetical protein
VNVLETFERLYSAFSSLPDHAMRNCIAMAVCVVLYGVFISGGERNKRRGNSRSMRDPDSILRDGAHGKTGRVKNRPAPNAWGPVQNQRTSVPRPRI